MSDVALTVELDDEIYLALLTAANEVGLPVSDYASRIVRDYLEVEGG
jgi:hypothetical protein